MSGKNVRGIDKVCLKKEIPTVQMMITGVENIEGKEENVGYWYMYHFYLWHFYLWHFYLHSPIQTAQADRS